MNSKLIFTLTLVAMPVVIMAGLAWRDHHGKTPEPVQTGAISHEPAALPNLDGQPEPEKLPVSSETLPQAITRVQSRLETLKNMTPQQWEDEKKAHATQLQWNAMTPEQKGKFLQWEKIQQNASAPH